MCGQTHFMNKIFKFEDAFFKCIISINLNVYTQH